MLQTYYPKPSRKLFLPFTYPIVLGGFVRVDMCNNLLDCYRYTLTKCRKAHRIIHATASSYSCVSGYIRAISRIPAARVSRIGARFATLR